MDLLDEAVSKVTLTADTAPERPQLTAPRSLRGSLLLADRGYFEVPVLAGLDEAAASYVIRGYVSINPLVLEAFDTQDRTVRSMHGKRLKDCRSPKRRMLDLDVQWGSGARGVRARIIASWNATKREFPAQALPGALHTAPARGGHLDAQGGHVRASCSARHRDDLGEWYH